MAADTAIEWTDHTFNPWWGCTKVAAGCARCYAEALSKRTGKAKWGAGGNRIKTSPKNWAEPFKWNALAHRSGVRQRVFCASMADVFEDWDGPILDHHGAALSNATFATAGPNTRPLTMDDLRRDLFELIDSTPWLEWLLLTKRPENIRRMWAHRQPPGHYADEADRPPHPSHRPNVWLLTSVAEQQDADRNVPELLKCRDLAPVLGLSCEPLLGSVELTTECDIPADEEGPRRIGYMVGPDDGKSPLSVTRAEALAKSGIGWVIAGGESGPGARPMHPDWARGLRDQCAAAGVAFFFKQWGEWEPSFDFDTQFIDVPQNAKTLLLSSDGTTADNFADMVQKPRVGLMVRSGKKHAGRLLDGVTHDAFPAAAAVEDDAALVPRP